MTALMPCGTVAAYQRHIRAGEKPCDPCAEASRVYATTKRGGYGRARIRACTRLAHAHLEEFLRLFDEELAKERR